MTPTFWQLARRPKWIAGLIAAALVAVIFSVLMQWQLERTFTVVGVDVDKTQTSAAFTDLVQPGALKENVYDRLATVTATIDPGNSYIIENRLQLEDGQTVEGYWLVANSFVADVSLTLALGFSQSVAEIETARAALEETTVELTGFIEPTEPPKPRLDSGNLESLSLAQLINLYSAEELESYPVYLIVQQGIDLGLEPISIEIRQQEIQINWLTAFYAVEWAFFALAAFYIWWRLVRDEQIRLAEEG